ncbi:MFS transporter [Haloimpatiens sp. FM7330]|uniref:MFS transporter n=1 Tax=Haloimpatiens sp. FM7330 TaxID=3298610 RepID=UPI00362546C8
MSTFFLISRCIIFSFAFVPFFPKQYRPMLFVILFAFMSVPEALSVMSLQSFSGDIFSDKKRSTAIAMRNKFSTLFNVITCLILGWTFKSLVKNNSQAVFLYQICFTVAFLIGLIEIHTFMKLKEITTIQVDKMSFKAISNIFKNKKFKTFLFCSLIFHFGWQMGWPLFSIYKIKYLNADEMWLTILNVSSNIVMFFSYNYWNKLIKRRGNTFVIAFATFGMSVTPLLYAVSFNLYVLTLTGIMTGFFTSGTTTVILSALLEVCPEKNRMFYIGLHATFTNLTLSIAPMVGHTVLEYTSIYAALGVSAAFRFIGSFAFFIRNKNMSKTQSTNITT